MKGLRTYIVISVEENERPETVKELREFAHESGCGSIVLRSSDGASGSHFTDQEWAAVDATYHQHMTRAKRASRGGVGRYNFLLDVPASGETSAFAHLQRGDSVEDALRQWAEVDRNVNPERMTWWGIPISVRRVG